LPKLYGCQVGLPNCWSCSNIIRFGPSFYGHFWHILKPKVMQLFNDFHNNRLDLDSLNRAHLILIPKKMVFAVMKLVPKSCQTASGLLFPLTIHPDQTGFVHGRSIAENFVYAADLVNCCQKRGAPTVVLKLHFEKSFSLCCLRQSRPHPCCSWV
jgi:hypothetical protein